MSANILCIKDLFVEQLEHAGIAYICLRPGPSKEGEVFPGPVMFERGGLPIVLISRCFNNVDFNQKK